MPKVLPSRYCASTIGALSILQSDTNKKNFYFVLLAVLFPSAEANLELADRVEVQKSENVSHFKRITTVTYHTSANY